LNQIENIHPFDLDSHEKVRQVVELAMKGAKEGFRPDLEKAFHKQAMMFGQVFQERFASPIDGFFDLCERFKLGRDGSYRSSIISITQVGRSAMVMVAEDGCWGSAAFVDFFTVTLMDSQWKITNKTFAYTGGEIPPEVLKQGWGPISIPSPTK
jgi:hypothetical protein